MSIPPELAWIFPVIVPLMIGLLVGAVVKKTSTFVIVTAALIIVLVAAGGVSLIFPDIYEKAMQLLPEVYDAGRAWINVLPYSAAALLIGFAPWLSKD